MSTTNTITMKLKLVSPKSSYTQKSQYHHKPLDDYFISTETTNQSNVDYNKKSPKLSQKSLELCTESLGSETGSDMSDNDVDALFSNVPRSKSRRAADLRSKKQRKVGFPPPLMTMSGSKLFRVMVRREGGRLVVEATETKVGDSGLRAERSDGRLRLTTCGYSRINDHEIEMMERNVQVIEKFQRVGRCNEQDDVIKDADKILCCTWEPSCWVAIS